MLDTVAPYPLENRPYAEGDWLEGQTATGQTVSGQYGGQTASGLLKVTDTVGVYAITPDSAHRVEPPPQREPDLTDLGDRLQLLQRRFAEKQAQAQTPEHPFKVGDRVLIDGDWTGTIVLINPYSQRATLQVDGVAFQWERSPRDLKPLPPPPPPPPKPPRRRSKKGEASGWIEERQGNRKRKTPSTSYYYGWQDGEGKHKRYIPAAKVHRVQGMIGDRRTVAEILDYLTGGTHDRG